MIKFLDPELIKTQLISFIKEYMENHNFKKGVVAISGGIDSTNTLYLLTEAIGKDNVISIFLPSDITSRQNYIDTEEIVKKLGIENHYVVNISPFVKSFEDNIPDLKDRKNKIRLGNIMARIRMIITYDFSSKFNALVVGTENKTEALLGYSTMWGDMAAGIHPMGDIYKTEVFSLGEYMKIPESILTKSPSAELWHNQTDEDEIGVKYKTIDEILYLFVEKGFNSDEIISQGYREDEVNRIYTLMTKNEYKRRFPLSAKFNRN